MLELQHYKDHIFWGHPVYYTHRSVLKGTKGGLTGTET